MIFLDLGMTLAAYGFVVTVLLMGVQGGLVWASAAAIAGRLGWNNAPARVALMVGCWAAWLVGGAVVMTLLGFGGGLFEGGIWLFSVVPSGIYGSLLALLGWLVWR